MFTAVQYLSECVVGATMEDVDEEAEEIEEGEMPKKKEGTFEVYATTTEKDSKKPEFVKELFNVRMPSEQTIRLITR